MSTNTGARPLAGALGRLFSEAPEAFREFLDRLPARLVLVGNDGRALHLNAPLHRYLGKSVELLDDGAWLECIHPDDRESTLERWASAQHGGSYRQTFRLRRGSDGSYRWHRAEGEPLHDEQGRLVAWSCVLTEIEDQFAATRRQAALAELGQKALEETAPGELFEQAVAIVRDALEVHCCKILTLLPGGDELLLEAGVGWDEGLVGTATVSAGRSSQAGFTLAQDGPVVVEYLPDETRFEGPSLLVEHGVVSGVSVVVRTPDGPYGVLGAHSRDRRRFGEEETNFLQSVAHVLGEAVNRSRREEVIRSSEERFRQVFENAAVGIAILSTDRQFVDVNGRLCEMFGYRRDELLALDPAQLGDEADRELTDRVLADVIAGRLRHGRYEKRYWRKDGRLLWADVAASAAVDRDGSVRYVVTALRDVTDRKRAEESLQRALEQEATARREAEAANERLVFLTNASHLLGQSLEYQETLSELAQLVVPDLADWCGVDVVDAEGRLRRLAVAHQDPEKVRLGWELYRRFPPDPASDSGPYRTLRTGEPEFYPVVPQGTLEATAVSEEHGRLLRQLDICSAIIVPLRSRGRTLGVITLVNADSKRHYDERDLALAVQLGELAGLAVDNARLYREARELNDELEARVKERTEELEMANRELEAFTYSTSHDLRAPLRGIDGFSEALLSDYGDSLDDRARHYLQRVRAGAQRMGELIDDLLGLSRVSRAQLQVRELDLADIAREVVRELAAVSNGESPEVRVEESMPVRGDPQLLRIALQNLLDNAFKFSRASEAPEIRVGVLERDSERVFFVADNGVGFDMAYADKLFVPFQRLHPASEFEGTGIGLTTVQRIISRHDGRIWVESEPGKGTTFYFTLRN